MKKYKFLPIIFIAIILTFSCTQENSSEMMSYPQEDFSRTESSVESIQVASGSSRALSENISSNLNHSQKDSRKVVQTISMEITVISIQDSIDTIHEATIENDGFIISSEIRDDRGKTYGFISIRIPRNDTTVLSNLIRNISERIIRENLYSNDVTDQYSDLSARINNMKIAEETYLRLFNEAKSIEDMVNIQEKINEIRWNIENLEGQINYMDATTSTTLINVSLQQSSDQQPIINEKWKPFDTLKDSLRDLVEFTQGFANILIRILIFSPIWIGILIVILLLRKVRWKKIKFSRNK